jgi:predicted nuclease of restriction endonuclease-like (RecB) superfamily
VRNWIIGLHIREYEQHGADRAQYGVQVLAHLARELQSSLDNCYTDRYLRLCRQFYETYPEIRKSLISKFEPPGRGKSPISELPALSEAGRPEMVEKPSVPSRMPPERLVEGLSFTHFVELLKLDDPMRRAFYETECIRGGWSVRELKRQIGSLYYERTGLSTNKDKLAEQVQADADRAEPELTIRDPYIFEFLGLKPREVMHESDLEEALLGKLQDFLLELGHGFCFEARQKRILLGENQCFVDLVLYHRVLKCHVLVELKVEPFSHENIGQLNTYVSWYREHMMTEGDNPPVGLLLCTGKNHALARYALAGMDNQLFVSRYQLQLPTQEEIEAFIEKQVRQIQTDLELPAPEGKGSSR